MPQDITFKELANGNLTYQTLDRMNFHAVFRRSRVVRLPLFEENALLLTS